MIPEIISFKERRILTQENLRKICIEYNFYTKGNNKDYANLMNFTKENVNLNTEEIVGIANDIKIHSETDYSLLQIIEIVINKCYTIIEKF